MLTRLHTDYIDLGMIHYVDSVIELEQIVSGEFYTYVKELKEKGDIRHIGLSTHNPEVGIKAVEMGIVEMILFSINPAFDLLPPTEDLMQYFADDYEGNLRGIDPVRTRLYQLCESHDVGITVMKGYAGGPTVSTESFPIWCSTYSCTVPSLRSDQTGCFFRYGRL